MVLTPGGLHVKMAALETSGDLLLFFIMKNRTLSTVAIHKNKLQSKIRVIA